MEKVNADVNAVTVTLADEALSDADEADAAISRATSRQARSTACR